MTPTSQVQAIEPAISPPVKLEGVICCRIDELAVTPHR